MTGHNETITSILARRSVRFGYDLARPVERAALDTVVRCGLSAPSSKNAQPWRFHVVADRDVLESIAAAAESAPGLEDYVPHDPATGKPHTHWQSTVTESAAIFREVPAAIFVENRGVFSGGRPGLTAASPEALAGALASYAFECVGIGAAIENMWIGANSLGLSAAFVGDVLIVEDLIRARLGIEGDLVGVLVCGYSDATPPPARPSPAATQVDEPVVWH